MVLAATYFPLASIIGTTELNFRVRNENGCDLRVEPPKPNFQSMDLKIYYGAGRNPPERTVRYGRVRTGVTSASSHQNKIFELFTPSKVEGLISFSRTDPPTGRKVSDFYVS